VNQKNFINNYQPPFWGWWAGSGAWGENSSFANFGRALACAICKCAVLWVGFLFFFSLLNQQKTIIGAGFQPCCQRLRV